ncbi:polysaccharide deacetylase family protein [Peredibacter starrii]|uniref:Polysaccharide deacetylase family protein n=1 Tax=Peredibacter starrii TaxID=28202 RepID=A0AAX4HMZ1_9BACT|nr:polysaccharide deacetylase family protein [Peredibacter starrii]WPU64531.1 polysaccharide deacetylase family protein [Peredibacter starrii]
MNSNFFNTILFTLCIFSLTVRAAEVSFTIDDPGVQSAPEMTHLQVGKKLQETLKANHLKTILFVCGMRVDSSDGKKLLSSWDDEGHILANHTYSHKNYNNSQITFDFFTQDIRKNENLIQEFKNFKRFFRYPMLKEGDTVPKRNGLRTFLKDNKYSVGHVTIDASDWYISNRMVEKLNQGKKVDFEAYKKYYLNHIWDRAQYYNQLSKEILGREIKHNVLIHHNPLNAYFLGDLIQMFKSKGWKVISAENAFKDPAYSFSPNNLPAGESLLWALAKESGKYESKLRYPAEDGEYQKEEMNKLGL